MHRFEGPVHIEGTFEGELLSNDWIKISPQAKLIGRCSAPAVLIEGTLLGDVEAGERITIDSTGIVVGSVATPWLDVRLGAQLKGRVDSLHGFGEE